MDKEDIKQTMLQVIEIQLESQLRAIRQLQGKPEAEPLPLPRRGRRRQSMVDLSVQILTAAAGAETKPNAASHATAKA